MSPQEKFKEILSKNKDTWCGNINDDECDWLMARIKQLEKALEYYAYEVEFDNKLQSQIARDALDLDPINPQPRMIKIP